MTVRPMLLAARTAAILTVVTSLVAVAPLGTAGAVTPPNPDVAAAPPDGPPGPEGPMRKNGACVVGGVGRGGVLTASGVVSGVGRVVGGRARGEHEDQQEQQGCPPVGHCRHCRVPLIGF